MHGLIGPRELIRAEAQGRPHRRVELPHRSLAELLDAEVDRPSALHRAVGQPLRQRAIAIVEPFDGCGESTVGIGLLLEDAPYDFERSDPRRCDHFSPRKNSS